MSFTVIFLRATYAELKEAGYTELDPKHRLFLEYRRTEEVPEQPIHDLSILSRPPRLPSLPLPLQLGHLTSREDVVAATVRGIYNTILSSRSSFIRFFSFGAKMWSDTTISRAYNRTPLSPSSPPRVSPSRDRQIDLPEAQSLPLPSMKMEMFAVSLAPLVVRRSAETDSEPVAKMLPAGSRLRCLKQERVSGTIRLMVARDGQAEPLGWISQFSWMGKELVSLENVHGLLQA